jgi:hypothetical protein
MHYGTAATGASTSKQALSLATTFSSSSSSLVSLLYTGRSLLADLESSLASVSPHLMPNVYHTSPETRSDLAIHTRLLFHTRGRHPRLIRWLILYPLYLISEAAIIATDLAEVLGSGIALTLLFPSLPLWGGVLLTSTDVFLLLLVGDPLRGRPVKTFEYFVGAIVLAVLVCMGVIVGRVHPHWGDVFEGFLPSKHIVERNGLYVCQCLPLTERQREHLFRLSGWNCRGDRHAPLALLGLGPGCARPVISKAQERAADADVLCCCSRAFVCLPYGPHGLRR